SIMPGGDTLDGMSWYHEDLPMSDPVFRAIAMVRRRLIRIVRLLEEGGVPFAVCGGWAVAGWVAEIDEDATRTTKDVDVLLRREDLERANAAVAKEGFEFVEERGVPMWLDPEDPRPKRAVHLVFANEITRAGDPLPAPDIEPNFTSASHPFPRVGFEEILRMKLLAWRTHDRAHLYDMVNVGLLKPEMVERFEGVLRERLQFIFDHPETSLG
ncbi:MAG: nucleotidyltransferase family protein, partial [Phycisphaerales bacterium]